MLYLTDNNQNLIPLTMFILHLQIPLKSI